MKSNLLMATIALLAMIAVAEAGSVGPGAFGPGTVTEDFEGLGLPFSNSTPIAIGGHTFRTDDGTLRYHSDFGDKAGGSRYGVGNNTDEGWIDIVLGVTAVRAGLNFGDYANQDWAGNVQFFDGSDALLGTVFGGGTDGDFAGWEDFGGIARIRINDTSSNGRIIHVDNVMAQAPEPAALGLVLLGVGAVVRRRRRKTA